MGAVTVQYVVPVVLNVGSALPMDGWMDRCMQGWMEGCLRELLCVVYWRSM